MQKEFLIPQENIIKLQRQFIKLTKRAEKFGIDSPELKLGISVNEKCHNKSGSFSIRKFQKVFVTWNEDCINGWKIVATLQHLPEGSIIRNISGQDVPTKYRNSGPECDHCQIKRKRNDTYVLQHESNKYQQIGSSCLESFLLSSPTKLLLKAQLISGAINIANAAETLPAAGISSILWPLELYLAHTVDVIKTHGWVAKSQAREEGLPSTSEIAFVAMTQEDPLLYKEPSLEAREEAATSMEWAENLDDSSGQLSEYLHNIKTIVLNGAVEHRTLGYAASIISAYRKANKPTKQMEHSLPGEHFGAIGERIELTLTIQKAISIDSNFGESWIFRMIDNKNNIFIWKTKNQAFDEGKDYLISGRVKEHTEYKGQKQTILTHCKLLE